MTTLIVLVLGLLLGGVVAVALPRALKGRGPVIGVRSSTVAQRVRRVGKLVGLEAQAKEITTSTQGWSWLPDIILSRARIAMIFHFQKQYAIDLSELTARDIVRTGARSFRVRMPEVEGSLTIRQIEPYDIQAGRILGLVEVLPMNAERQGALMDAAHEQAAEVFRESEGQYIEQARRSIERQISSVLDLVGVDVTFSWPGVCAERGPGRVDAPGPVEGCVEDVEAPVRLALTA